MLIRIIGMIIGAMVAGVGLYYLIKERQDKESRRIYGVASCAGGIVFVGMLVSLLLTMME